MSDLLLICADARHIPLADETVQCVVTSPPYWGLRKYAGKQELVWGLAGRCEHEWGERVEASGGSGLQGVTSQRKGRSNVEAQEFERGRGCRCIHCGAWRGAYGLEPTIEMYIAHTVEILREIRRVLRKDGVVFWNTGDSYASGEIGRHDAREKKGVGASNKFLGTERQYHRPERTTKPKDLCLIPARVALAAQADGWWIRSMIIWAKPNPMPESVTDRPTDAYEHILMLTKSARYFWDEDAVREPSTGNTHSRGVGNGGPKAQARGSYEGWTDGTREVLSSRYLRNVWTFPTQPYSGAHFATFPEALPRRCILAATSAKGACKHCGAPWERVTRRKFYGKWNPGPGSNGPLKVNAQGPEHKGANWQRIAESRDTARSNGGDHDNPWEPPQTIGWRPTCRCRGQRGQAAPCLVLDPFGGSGTTGRVAVQLRRRAVLLDLAYAHDYGPLAKKRTTNVQMEAFS